MEHILRPIYQERASHPNTLGVIIIEKGYKTNLQTDTFDAILLIILKDAEQPWFVKHYTFEDKKAAMHIVTDGQLKEWILFGSNRKIFDWLLNGRVLFDRNEYMVSLKTELREFPFYGRKLKMGLEFAKLIRRYIDGKTFFENNQSLDAFNHVVHSLHHLARLAVIENGFHPEVTVWQQVKQIEPEIFKLYEELVNSTESLDKRLELLFLASEFLIHSRTIIGISHLMDVLSTKEYWSFQEMMENTELSSYSVDLEVLLEYLIDKNFIRVMSVETKGLGVYHRYYKVKEKLS
ncbi:nucleotidyltransferase-like protein [Bacillus sp. CGMCC 1.16607]|uniref:nucleotidyltransferase-like protein n=1 Tax=Bacillus sp. CGMCC 1.16607 TaxID=3351842 RepID=UPI003637BE1D